jgi:hypothetical protein
VNKNTFNAFISYAIKNGFKAENNVKYNNTVKLTFPDDSEKYNATLYRLSGYIYMMKADSIFVGMYDGRLVNIDRAKEWIDRIVEEIELGKAE